MTRGSIVSANARNDITAGAVRLLSLRNLAACTVAGALIFFLGFIATYAPPPPDTAAARETANLPPLAAADIHKGLAYGLDEVATQKIAPPVFVKSLDVDLNRIPDVAEKKRTFFRILLPIIARENDRIRAERRKIAVGGRVVPAALYRKYGVREGDIAMLRQRADVVPASLILAQAALESGWGTSRFARHGNNFFGMRTYDEDVPGIDPHEADGFKLRSFKDIAASVRAYIGNMNTHSAYEKLREERAKMRKAGEIPRGRALAAYLTAYSEIPEKYGARLREMIDLNGLDRFDGVRLAER